MQIESGKYYKTREGLKVGPMIKANWGDVYYQEGFDQLDGTLTWYRGGEAGYNKTRHINDLIEEWIDDSPVREVTVTRREIVPGTYGVVKVHYHDETELIVNLTKKRLTIEEMRDAAHVLNQIAEAMENE